MALRLVRISKPLRAICQLSVRSMSTGGGEWGSGAGKGGGGGGAIRSAGGTFGKIEATREEQYFRKLSAQQMEALKEHHHDEIASLEKQIKEEQDELTRHKKKLEELQNLVPKE
ncbi:hypothetical protein LSAT2_029192 [Lamellibrachia satsuma]|nr:hypothetical protein LSAT2_029192 [Lamellibrachia satsuma]